MMRDLVFNRSEERNSNPRNPSLEDTVPMTARPGTAKRAGEFRTANIAQPAVTGAAEDLRQRVELFLAGSNLPSLRRLRVEAQDDQVLLSGEVQTFYERQMAIQFAARVAGVIHIVDSIQVRGYQPLPQVGRDDVPRRPTFTIGY